MSHVIPVSPEVEIPCSVRARKARPWTARDWIGPLILRWFTSAQVRPPSPLAKTPSVEMQTSFSPIAAMGVVFPPIPCESGKGWVTHVRPPSTERENTAVSHLAAINEVSDRLQIPYRAVIAQVSEPPDPGFPAVQAADQAMSGQGYGGALIGTISIAELERVSRPGVFQVFPPSQLIDMGPW